MLTPHGLWSVGRYYHNRAQSLTALGRMDDAAADAVTCDKIRNEMARPASCLHALFTTTARGLVLTPTDFATAGV